MKDTPRPSEPMPLKMPKLFINGKEYPFTCDRKYGTFDPLTGMVTYYDKRGDAE